MTRTHAPVAIHKTMWTLGQWPLGAHYSPWDACVTFAVFAPDATRVCLEIYPVATGKDAIARFTMRRCEGGIWRARIGDVGPGTLYGFRCWGPNWPHSSKWRPGSNEGFICDVDADGFRFNPNKVLFDPYAREISHNPQSPVVEEAGYDLTAFGTGGGLYEGRPRRDIDTGPVAPKGIVIYDETPTGVRPDRAQEESAIYEAHIKNLTLHPSASKLGTLLRGVPGFAGVTNVPAHLRGTYAGAGYMAPYLRGLGFTTIELLPVHETSSNSVIGQTQGINHWGYQTLGFFAPNRDYAHDKRPGGPTREFKEMVAAFHDAGIEVYLDVVYNHTGEGGHWDGDLDTTGFVSLGGFASSRYYLMNNENRLIDGATGCSNQVNYSTPAARDLVLDSLHYWTDVMGVDGFRFDLAPVLGRRPNRAARENWPDQRRFYGDHPLLTRIRDFAARRGIEVIAEAWDLWGYEVGNFPAGWAEWNGRYRDALRSFLKGDGNTRDFMDVVNGDFAHFANQGGPQFSINFVTAHDGFTLMDLVSYNHKINEQPYPFGPSDGGTDDNRSWDSGGDHALRRQRMRNFWLMLFLSRGVPMVVSGDEFGRTQNGNNNPWALNSAGIWNNYAFTRSHAPTRLPVDPDHSDPGARGAAYHDNFGASKASKGVNPYFRFAATVARFRRAHKQLRQTTYGNAVLGDGDVGYFFSRPDGTGYPENGDRALRLFIEAGDRESDDLLLAINMHHEPVTFRLPYRSDAKTWRRIFDTSTHYESRSNYWPLREAPAVAPVFDVPAWAITVLRARTD